MSAPLLYAILFLQQLIAASTHVVGKSLTNTIHPTVLLLLRAGLASLVFAIWIYFNRKKLKFPKNKDLAIFVLLGALCIPLNQYFFFLAVDYTAAPNVALAYALVPAFVLLLDTIFLRNKATLLKILGIIVAFAGATMIFSEQGIDLSSEFFIGNLIALAGSLSWAIYTIIGKKIIKEYGSIFSTGLAIILGYLLYLPIYFAIGDTSSFAFIDSTAIIKILYLGLFTSVVGYALWYWMLERMDASKLSVFNNLQPIITALLAFIFLSFNFTLPFVIGGIMVIIGVFLTQKG